MEDVVDGDTIVVTGGTRVRLIGVDTPETKDPRQPVQCFGVEASSHTASLLSREEGRGLWSACGDEPAVVQPEPPPVVPVPSAVGGIPRGGCDPAYPDVCIPPAPPHLDCGDISERRFRCSRPIPTASTATATVRAAKAESGAQQVQ